MATTVFVQPYNRETDAKPLCSECKRVVAEAAGLCILCKRTRDDVASILGGSRRVAEERALRDGSRPILLSYLAEPTQRHLRPVGLGLSDRIGAQTEPASPTEGAAPPRKVLRFRPKPQPPPIAVDVEAELEAEEDTVSATYTRLRDMLTHLGMSTHSVEANLESDADTIAAIGKMSPRQRQALLDRAADNAERWLNIFAALGGDKYLESGDLPAADETA